MSPLISIVSPVYRGEAFVSELVSRVTKSVNSISSNYEIILVNDSSPDMSWEKILDECRKDKKVIGINLSRNFGQHYAISAGLEHVNGDWIIVMDCDLQDVPEEIPQLYYKALEGYDVVLARRMDRRDSASKKLFSFLFYHILSYLTGVKYDHKVANFGIYNRKVIEGIKSMGDSIRYFPSMVKWVGFKSTTVVVQHNSRQKGQSSYNFKRLMHLAMDIILSYSDKPIRLTIKSGVLISVLAFAATLYAFIRALFFGFEVSGYASLIISVWFFSGLIISIIGVVGLYVSKTFQAARNRPIYIIADKINYE